MNPFHLRQSLVLLSIVALGCTSTVLATPTYQPQSSFELGPGVGSLVRISVIDERSDKLALGITEDMYKERIELTRPLEDVVAETFGELLSEAGYRISERAALTYEVRTRDAALIAAHALGARARARVSLQVNILANGDDLGGVVTVGNGEVPGSATSAAPSQALAIALSEAIEEAVGSPALTELVMKAAAQ